MTIAGYPKDTSLGEKLTQAVHPLGTKGLDGEGRIIGLSDDMPRVQVPPTITRELHVKAIDEARRTVDFVASTGAIDSHEEIVDQGSWILDDYLKNPVVLWAHDSRDLPIGRSVDVAVRNNGEGARLECRIEFASAELNPKAEQVFRMLQTKYLRAVSVGFVPKSYRWEMRGGVEVWVWSDCILKEVSVVPIPANSEALAKMKAANPRANKSTPASPGPQPPDVKESIMDKEIEAKLAANATAIAELKLEAKTLGEKATKAESDVRSLEAQVKTLQVEKTALEAQAQTLAADRDAEKASKEKAEKELADAKEKAADAVIEHDVDKLVGKKIKPTEKDMFVELRKTNSTLFAKMVEQRPDLKLEEVVTEKGAASNNAPQKGTDDLVTEINQSVGL